jgi:pilus assembly protein CpaC
MTTLRSTAGALVPIACLIALSFVSAAPSWQVDGPQPSANRPTVPAGAELPSSLTLTVGKSTVIESALPLERISVGFGDIAEATAVGPNELLLNAKTPGVTSLIVWQEGGAKKFFDVTVVASHLLADNKLEAVRGELSRELPGQSIDLSFENETVFLRGTVKDLTSADRAVSIAGTLGKTVNLLYVDVPAPEAQVLLKVKFASVDRSLAQTLGLNLLTTGAGNTIGSIGTEQFSPPTLTTAPNTPVSVSVADALNLFFLRRDINLGATIKALEVKGLLQILAEPNMLAENGKQASFLAGGEFPFPSVSSGTGGTPTVSIQFREFGVRLTFLPVITPRGTIHLEVAPEVSALDFTNGLNISGFNVPALTTRKMNTQVELSEGQSFAIGGLLDNRITDTFEKVPFIGDIPILGKLFQSKSVSKQNTELIVIVTPELVRPVPSGQSAPALNYPQPFMAPNTPTELRTPGVKTTGPVPVTPPLLSIPVEKLIKSLIPPSALPATQTAPAAKPAGSPPAQPE